MRIFYRSFFCMVLGWDREWWGLGSDLIEMVDGVVNLGMSWRGCGQKLLHYGTVTSVVSLCYVDRYRNLV